MQFDFLDPMRRDYRGRETDPGVSKEIVKGDIVDLECCDVVLASALKPSWGTAMEIRSAYAELGKKVITVCPQDKPSPWLIEHSTKIVKTFEEAFEILKELAPTIRPSRVLVYLCGGINGLSDSDCTDWREATKEALKNI